MENIFGVTIQDLRKKKFPGLSLRKVGDRLSEEFGFQRFFYTQLNKMELGFVLPSSEILAKLLDAYGASDSERIEVVKAYAKQLTEEKVRMVAEDTNVDYPKVQQAVFYRKLPKDKK